MRASTIGYLAAVVLAVNVHGGTYQTTFSAFPNPGDVSGFDNWVINDATPQLSYVSIMAGSKAASLGGFFNPPATEPTVALSHPYGEALASTLVTFSFSISDSDNVYNQRDQFGVQLRNGAVNLFTVLFTPVSQSATPEAELNAQWNLSQIAGADPAASLTQGVLEGGLYQFELLFTPNGLNTDWQLTTTGNNVFVRNGSFVSPAAIATDFSMLWTPTGGVGTGGLNTFSIDNLALVPEASTYAAGAVLGLAGLGMFIRRKRA